MTQTKRSFTGNDLMHWEDTLAPGDTITALWTNSYRHYEVEAQVVRVNRASIRVKLTEEIRDYDGRVMYPVGRAITVPRVGNRRHGPGNCAWPLDLDDIDRAAPARRTPTASAHANFLTAIGA